jgi:RNA polymerase sigma-70 factor (ECF subfamily)
MLSSLKEKFLLYRIRAKKDPEAFGEIYDLFSHRIYRFIYFKVQSAEQAEDLTSETFLKAWQYLKEKREVPNLQALLYTVARNVVIDHYRRTAHEQGDVTLDDAMAVESPEIASDQLIRDTENNFDTARVLDKLRGLKDEYREVITMKYLDELDTSEIAAALGKTPANVRVLLHRATKALTAVVEDHHELQQATRDNLRSDKE